MLVYQSRNEVDCDSACFQYVLSIFPSLDESLLNQSNAFSVWFFLLLPVTKKSNVSHPEGEACSKAIEELQCV